MKSTDYGDIMVFSNEPLSLSEHISKHNEYKKSLRAVSSYLIDEDDSIRFYKEFTNKSTEGLYRKRDDSSDAIVALWMSRVKKSVFTYSAFNNAPSFEAISKSELFEIARLSRKPDFMGSLNECLISKGIVLVIEPSIPGLKLDGCVFILDNDLAVVALSLRYNRVDNFWFTLMHELSHLCLHRDELKKPILEDLDKVSDSLVELQADKLALSSFVSRSDWRTCRALVTLEDTDVIDFAKRMDIHPAIIAGRIRKEKNNYRIFSNIINKDKIKRD